MEAMGLILENNAMVFGINGQEFQPFPPKSKWGIERVNSRVDGYGLNFWKYGYYGNLEFRSVMFFNDSDNVGIGTNDPQERLHIVNGNLLLSSHPTSTSSGAIMFKLSNTQQHPLGIEYVNSITEGKGLSFWRYVEVTPSKDYVKSALLFLSNANGYVGMRWR